MIFFFFLVHVTISLLDALNSTTLRDQNHGGYWSQLRENVPDEGIELTPLEWKLNLQPIQPKRRPVADSAKMLFSFPGTTLAPPVNSYLRSIRTLYSAAGAILTEGKAKNLVRNYLVLYLGCSLPPGQSSKPNPNTQHRFVPQTDCSDVRRNNEQLRLLLFLYFRWLFSLYSNHKKKYWSCAKANMRKNLQQ